MLELPATPPGSQLRALSRYILLEHSSSDPQINGVVVVVVFGQQPQVRLVRGAGGARPRGLPRGVLLAPVQAHRVRAAAGHDAHRHRHRHHLRCRPSQDGSAAAAGRRGTAGVRRARPRSRSGRWLRRRAVGGVRGVPRGDRRRGDGPPPARVRPQVPRRVHRPVV